MSYDLTIEDTENGLLFYQGLHSYLFKGHFEDIWGKELKEHMIDKYEQCAYQKHGFTYYNYYEFYASLDPGNKKRLVAWYNKIYKQHVNMIFK